MQKCWKHVVDFLKKHKQCAIIVLIFLVSLAINIGFAYSSVTKDLHDLQLQIELNKIAISSTEPDIPKLEDVISDLEDKISDLEDEILDLEGDISELYESLK